MASNVSVSRKKDQLHSSTFRIAEREDDAIMNIVDVDGRGREGGKNKFTRTHGVSRDMDLDDRHYSCNYSSRHDRG